MGRGGLPGTPLHLFFEKSSPHKTPPEMERVGAGRGTMGSAFPIPTHLPHLYIYFYLNNKYITIEYDSYIQFFFIN